MPNYLKQDKDIEFNGGDLLINVTDFTTNDFGKFVSVGATEKDAGGIFKIGSKEVVKHYSEADLDEPDAEWVTKQSISFETTLAEVSLDNTILALGEQITISDFPAATPKYKSFVNDTFALPKKYPFIYKVRQYGYPGLYWHLIMPLCEVIATPDIDFKDEKQRTLKLVLNLRRVKDVAHPLYGKKFELRREYA